MGDALMGNLKMLSPRIAALNTRRVKPPTKTALPAHHSAEWRSLVAKVIEQRGRRCEECGATGLRIYADHKHELRDGGAPFDPSNIRLLCATVPWSQDRDCTSQESGEDREGVMGGKSLQTERFWDRRGSHSQLRVISGENFAG